MGELFELFWGGPFSQWTLARMYDFKTGITFNCNEQYMMYMKAEMFGDEEAREAILKEHDPRKQKKLGRGVKNFDAEIWEQSCQSIVKYANYMKFTQNRKMYMAMFDCPHDCVFVEASPFDNIWGIGLAEDDPDCLNRSTWQGKNWLGVAITEVRDMILADINDISAEAK